ncbi:ribosome small subunit-dependent GTPase A [Oleiphilus messinensis]|uniref:Small ribosomal subunit biogenesis GTPase RsgA n=1 Tax=Oleiphilus messinensis TaxID=141451 RepID=A0A1Y0I5Y8_9GAMM|nr:small ribosomal subunit biogenesis GTPase RsgA [Oleiphilus messinensis]ARU55897.1 ribosome small subunit-dependent GTPase A [Oleiphilus messinensis]
MSKRKLNRRQKWRIEKIQEEKALRALKKERNIGRQIQSGDLSCEQRGTIIAHFGKQIDVEALEGEDKGSIHRCHVRANIEALVTGDEVIWRAAPDSGGVIEALLPRRSLLQRPDNYGVLKPVASNIDHIIIVQAPVPEPYPTLLDRYLVAAETMDITPVILLNKTDLINEQNREYINTLFGRYSDLGYRVIHASAKQQDGLQELFEFTQDKTTVFVGQSGVGKSSLIQMLLPEEEIKVGALSEFNQKGTHTTTTAKLFHLPMGGNLIDSPGIREFGLWHVSEDELVYGFREFRPYLGQCKFRNCQHRDEPGCGLKSAFSNGDISTERMNSYRQLRDSLDDLEIRP